MRRVYEICHNMVTKLGMGGFRLVYHKEDGFKNYSEKTNEKIDREILKIVDANLKQVELFFAEKEGVIGKL